MHKELEIIHQRNLLMTGILWFSIIADLLANLFMIADNLQVILLVGGLGIPLCIGVTWFVRQKKHVELTMFIITFLVLSILFAVNTIDVHHVNLYFLLLPPLLSMMYRQWKNILFAVTGSFAIHAYFLVNNNEQYFTDWSDSYLSYYFIVYATMGIIMILEARMSERLRITAMKNEAIALEAKKQADIEAEEQIRYLAYYDTLTGLSNRNHFYKLLKEAMQSSKLDKLLLGIMFLDLDNFKKVNDSLGHSFGDDVLKEVSDRLRRVVRDCGNIFRMGGDEFILLMPRIHRAEEVIDLADKIKAMLKHPYQINGIHIYLTVSIGISIYPNDGETDELLVKHADMAMYRAKEEGKDNFQLFAPAAHAQPYEELLLENDLRQAIADNRLLLHYQPQVDLETGRIYGVEALVRWLHPENGLISPVRFIPIAEKTGLIVDLGKQVLFKACKQTKEWQDRGFPPLTVSVNLSSRQFLQPDLIETIAGILEQTGLDPKYVKLEITESMTMDVELATGILEKLKRLGVKISIDDFGTGYSSLNYLKILHVDELKIDKSFVQEISTDEKDAAIVSTIITMAKNLDLHVIAEGVETPEQLVFLKQKKCDGAQGYLMSKPLPVPEFERLLEKERPVHEIIVYRGYGPH